MVTNVYGMAHFLRILFTCFFVLHHTAYCDDIDHIDKRLVAFTFAMQKELSKAVDGNTFFSPYSIYVAFLMLRQGARRNTRKEIDDALNWNDDLLDEVKFLQESIGKNEKSFSSANKMWVDDTVELSKRFNDTLVKFFHVEMGIVRFSGESEKSRLDINEWIAKQTGGHIKDLFPPGSINSLTQLVVGNAIYFKGKWAFQFDVKNTRKGRFYVGEKSVEVDYMWRNGNYSSYFDSRFNVNVLEVPYEHMKFSMVFIVPPKSQIEKVGSLINADVFGGWMQKLEKRNGEKIDIYIPKFKIEESIDLITHMEKLGIRDLFTPGKADLSEINGKKNLYCGSALHKSFIEVDEEGTTAAGATAVGINYMSMPRHIRIDRPFFFHIIHKASNTIIFSGKVMNPAA